MVYMAKNFNRRDFLKLSFLGLGTLALADFPPPHDLFSTPRNLIGRVTVDRVAPIYKEPKFHSGIVRYTRQDELLNIYYELNAPDGPAYNPVWYRVWGGYIHSAYVQRTQFIYNQVIDQIPETGQLAEITIPYTQAYTYSSADGWLPIYRLYFQTTHWVTDIVQGPASIPLYEITSEIDSALRYYLPAMHMRFIPDEELSPISPTLPYEAKKIVVNLTQQRLTAYENDNIVYEARISSGLPGKEVPDGTRTPRGKFHITSKMPSKHMGSIRASGAPDNYILPGVPWTSFFIFETGVAFHGTFWHNNFGTPMSHGCINMRNEDAKWLFRWVTPVYTLPIKEKNKWDVRGYGTQVIIE